MSKFHKGEKVIVIKYGHLSLNNSSCQGCTGNNGEWADVMSFLIGREGIINRVEFAEEKFVYTLDGIPEKNGWYDEQQLAIIS